MPINQKFLAVLSDTSKLALQSDGREAALEALITATLKPAAMTAAMRDHKAFWNGVEPGLVSDDATFERTDLILMKQKAAEQRIALGLSNAPIDILVAILTHNGEECRRYIESKKLLPATAVSSVTDNGIKSIQREANKQLLSLTEQKLNQVNDLHQLIHLNNLVTENDTKALINSLFSIDFTGALPNAVPESFKSILDSKITHLVSHVLRHQLDRISLASAHSHLLDALTSLPIAKQIKIVRSNQLALIIDAQDNAAITQYLGEGIANIEAILAENKSQASLREARLSSLRGIHNAALAHTLSRVNGLKLADDGVEQINEVLHALPDFSTSDGVKQFVDDISRAFSDSDNVSLYQLFGLSVNGQAIDYTDILEPIRQQHQYNLGLMDVSSRFNRQEVGYPYKQLFNLFLSIEKNMSLADGGDSFVGLNRYISLLDSEQSKTAFLQKCPDDTPQEQEIKAQLDSRLTPQLFSTIQREIRMAKLLKDHDRAREALYRMQTELQDLAKSYNPLIAQLKTLDYLVTLEPSSLGGPTFQAKTITEKKALHAKYRLLHEQCDTVYEQLKRDYNRLNDHLNNLPSKDQLNALSEVDKHLGVDNIQKIEAYYLSIPVEMENIAKALKNYELVRNKTQEIVTVLDNAVEGGVYREVREGVSCRAVAKEDIRTNLPTGAKEIGDAALAAEVNGKDARSNKELLKSSDKEDAFIYDTLHNSANHSVQIQGRFSQTYPQDVVPAPSSIKDNGKKQPACRIQVEQMPMFTKMTGDEAIDNKEQEHAKVKFFLEMAAATLAANHGKAPTKENPIRLYGSNAEDMKYLWTALVLLGEGKPKFGKDAISVQTSSFVPKNEEGRFYGYSDDSLYNQVFKKYKDDVLKTQNYLERNLSDEAHSKATKVMDKFKSGLDKVKHDPKAVQRLVAEEGAAPEPQSSSMQK